MLATPAALFAQGVQFIDTESYRASGSQLYVRTKMDVRDGEVMRAFPTQIGDRTGWDTTSPGLEEALGADILFLRTYSLPDFPLPIFFLIVQSKSSSSLHPPPVYYIAQGWEHEGEEDGKVNIPISDVSWAEIRSGKAELESIKWLAEGKQRVEHINANKVVVHKESNGEVRERRVALYFYLKGAPIPLGFGSNPNKITMIRVSTLAPENGSYEGVLDTIRNFTGARSSPTCLNLVSERKSSL